MSSWNEIPFTEFATPQQKGDEFDRQYEENMVEGSNKEYSGQYRPEPEGTQTGQMGNFSGN